ncbi:hypothetical protein [Planococcus massiliensis]|uniref:hypothetical protein n=1 Tax=Planococcus massiliensis TaxID=1499687 RepID=UPI0018FE7E6E|nr:hypothetical protein [Planococcus massiliensis]
MQLDTEKRKEPVSFGSHKMDHEEAVAAAVGQLMAEKLALAAGHKKSGNGRLA